MAQLPKTYDEMMEQVPNFMLMFNGEVSTDKPFVPMDPTPLEVEIMHEVFEQYLVGTVKRGAPALSDAEKKWLGTVFFTAFMSGMNFAAAAMIRLHQMKSGQN
jgi:hypothetical protein